jgi:hypothetical protein
MEKFKIDSKTEVLFDEKDWIIIENGISQLTKSKNLYKYYSLTEFSLDSLKNNYVYLNNPINFNDPFDCNRNLIIEKQKQINEWEYVETLNDISKIGIASFSENGMEPLLWSHYANSYRGFCVKFKPDFINQKNNEQVKLKKVIYSDKPTAISIDSKFSEYYQYILKLNDWNYEKEWRLLFHNPSSVQSKFFFDADSIEEISIGYKFLSPSSDYEIDLKKQFDELRKGKFKSIPLYTVGPHNTKLELEKMKLVQGTIEDGLEMINRTFERLFKGK